MLKLVRVLRASRIFKRWENDIKILYSVRSVIKLAVGLLTMSHWLACLWGLSGLSLVEFECFSGTGEEEEMIRPQEFQGVSWVSTVFSDGGKGPPDNPCNPAHVYAASLHWSVMTITSIGYGDIVPMRFEEYIVCIIGMLMGGVTWAYIIGEFCGVVANMDPFKTEFQNTMDALNFMFQEHYPPVSNSLQRSIRGFFREAHVFYKIAIFRSLEIHISCSNKATTLKLGSFDSNFLVVYLCKISTQSVKGLPRKLSFFLKKGN